MIRKPGFPVGIALALLMLFLTACSGGHDPVNGNLSGKDEGLGLKTQSVDNPDSRILWGYWNVILDPTANTAEIIPARGLMMHVNAVEWMQPPAGKTSNLQVQIIDITKWLSDGRIDVNVTLKHPFPGLDQFTGFDVMGVFITDGHRSLTSQPGGITFNDGGVLDATMLNPDGYTRWWNQDEFFGIKPRLFAYQPGALGIKHDSLDAKVNPYKYFSDGITALDDECLWLQNNPDKRGIFSAGGQLTRRYELVWPKIGGNPQLAFDYAVVANWEEPTVTPPENVPDDFPLKANAYEPVALSVDDNSTLYFNEAGGIAGGDIMLNLEAYSWQGPEAGQISNTIDRVIVEILDSPCFPGGESHVLSPVNWSSPFGQSNSSVVDAEIIGLTPSATGTAPVMILFETDADYGNDFGTPHPTGVLTSYFLVNLTVSPFLPGEYPPECEDPVPEFTQRNVMEIEEFTASVGDPDGDPYFVDWSVVPYGDAPIWQNFDDDTIIVNWWNVTADGTMPGDYDVCVRVYNDDGDVSCCTIVTVDPAPTLTTVSGQAFVLITAQPDQGVQPCDITVADSGSGSRGEIMFQDTSLSEIRMYKFNDTYTGAPTGIVTLNQGTTLIPPLEMEDFHKFDSNFAGNFMHLTSGNPTWPSHLDPSGFNINDPYHAFIFPTWNTTGVMNYLSLFGDVGSSGSPDPDSLAWKHVVDWTFGVTASTDSAFYGLMTISEEWLPNHPAMVHPGQIYMLYSVAPYSNPGTQLSALGLPGMSTQYTSPPGPVNDTAPDFMALGVDNKTPWNLDWQSGPGEKWSYLTIWYVISSEPTATDRKIHFIWLPEDKTIGYFAYDEYIGVGSPWGVDFGSGGVPVDVEPLYTSQTGAMLDHNFNWFAVLVDTAASWEVQVFRYDPMSPRIDLVDKFVPGDDALAGTPQALDVDAVQNEIHVLHRDTSNNYRVTVLNFTP